MQENISKLKNLLSTQKQIVVTTHRGPDGDAMGSALAMFHFLKELGHIVNVIIPNLHPEFLHWMSGNKHVLVFEEDEELANKITQNADLIFLLDFNHLSRISDFSDTVSLTDVTKILIDHHQNPDTSIADIIFSDSKACSTAQMVYEIIDALGFRNYINKEIAECLYVGIMTDTGSFKYPSTNAKTHRVVSDLIEMGIDTSRIHDLIYDNSSSNRINLLGYCLYKKLLLYPKNNSAILSLSSDELDRFQFKKGDTEGFVNFALGIKGIRFAAFIVEKEGVVKLSLRSKGNIKVNEIASKYFNGGGHVNAAGGISSVSINETIKILEEIINNYITNQ